VHPGKRVARELLVGTSELGRESALGPSEDDLVRDLRFYLQRYSFANRRMSFGFVKISVKIALLNAPNISGLDAATKYFFVMTAVNAEESRISNEVAYTVNTSSTL
jgi:hypothetical protein